MEHIDFNREPTNKEICMMCHFSSECGKCCKICNDQCNGKQHCQIGVSGQADRLGSWMDIVLNNVEFARLKCFIDENYGKPVVINQVCTCTEVRQTPVINGKNICSICNKPVVQTCL